MFNIKVENMVSDKGNSVINQFIIRMRNHKYFQSYKTIICVIDSFPYENDVITLDRNWKNYSNTTHKYLYRFLNMNKSAIIKAVKNGIIRVENIN